MLSFFVAMCLDSLRIAVIAHKKKRKKKKNMIMEYRPMCHGLDTSERYIIIIKIDMAKVI